MNHPSSCSGCPLDEKGKGFTQIEGTGSSRIMVIAEASGDSEARDSLPLRPYAASGAMFTRLLSMAGVDRQQFSLTNICRCQPPKNKLSGAAYEHEAIAHCRPNLESAIAQRKPKVIFALGDIALRSLTGMTGEKRSISYLRGYPLPYIEDSSIHVVSTFHPAFIQRGSSWAIPVALYDLKMAIRIAKGGFEPKPVKYDIHPSLDDAWGFVERVRRNPTQLLTYDIETPNSKDTAEDEREDDPSYEILSIQFSLAPQEGIFFPWKGGYIDAAKAILAEMNPKANHNVLNFDNPRLRHHKAVINGRIDDTLHMWGHLQPDLPGHLQGVASFFGMDYPWKHLSKSEEETYGCADVDAVQRIMATLPSDLKMRGVWDSYERHVHDFYSIMSDMSDRGMPIDDGQRVLVKKSMENRLTQLDIELQPLIPDAAKVKKCYKGLNPELRGLLKEGTPIEDIESRHFLKTRIKDDVEEIEGYRYQFIDGKWWKLGDFLPNSGPQLVAYMKAKGHKVPLKREEDDEGNRKTSTEKKELERLFAATKDPVYKIALEMKEAGKFLGTYLNKFEPAEDGCVHTVFTFSGATGQLGSKKIPILNIPKRSALAKAIRQLIVAKAGHKLVEIDMRAFHARTLGFEARDASYMRAADLDIHSLVSGHVLKVHDAHQMLEKSDDELRDYFKWYKSDPDRLAHRDNKAKPSCLGIGFGLGARKLYQMNLESFESEKEARMVIDTIRDLFPPIFAYQEATREDAHIRRFILSPYKFIRWFWDVKRWDSKQRKMVNSTDAESCVAFKPANDAFGMIRDTFLRMDAKGMLDKYGLCNAVHDSAVFHCPDRLVEECIHLATAELMQPSLVLSDPKVAPDGLVVGAEPSVGNDWSKMEKVELRQAVYN